MDSNTFTLQIVSDFGDKIVRSVKYIDKRVIIVGDTFRLRFLIALVEALRFCHTECGHRLFLDRKAINKTTP